MNNHIEQIVNEAYGLYMPQVRQEITALAGMVLERYSFTKKSQSFNILEIGTKFGGTFFIWNKINTDGLNISIDMSDGIHGGINEIDMNHRDAMFKDRFGNCHFIRGNSHEMDTHLELMRLFYPKFDDRQYVIDLMELGKFEGCIDVLFIDGDHTYEGVKQDFEMYSPFVKNGGLICFHDINDTTRHRERNVFVSKFWQEIKLSYPIHSEINANLDWAGIGVLVNLRREYTEPVIEELDGPEVMTVEEWAQSVEDGLFGNYDGSGYWAKNGFMSRDGVFSSLPLDATHVVWYNK